MACPKGDPAVVVFFWFVRGVDRVVDLGDELAELIRAKDAEDVAPRVQSDAGEGMNVNSINAIARFA
jgi:hypothetical protein